MPDPPVHQPYVLSNRLPPVIRSSSEDQLSFELIKLGLLPVLPTVVGGHERLAECAQPFLFLYTSTSSAREYGRNSSAPVARHAASVDFSGLACYTSDRRGAGIRIL